jgi:DNA-binding NarL/FixJ family response regulator
VERTQSAIAHLVGKEAEEEVPLIRDEELTDAEWRVAEAITRGRSNKEIAASLNLSIRTVENHVSRILAKKNLSNRVEIALAILGARNGTKNEAAGG